MDREERKIHHTSTIITNPELELEGINRRDFIIFLSVLPLTVLPNQSNAGFPLIPLGVRLFGRPIINFFSRIFFSPKNILKPKIRVPKNTTIAIENAIKINNRKNDLARTGIFLTDQLWKQGQRNTSSTVITNPSNTSYDTGDIKVQLRDEDTANVDVQAIIESIKVPKESNLLLQIGFNNLPNEGVKRLHGVYNHQQNAENSGRILVAKNTKGQSIDSLYRRYNKKYDGGEKMYTF